MTKAMPLSFGTAESNSLRAASPPADAPIPTIGKLDRDGGDLFGFIRVNFQPRNACSAPHRAAASVNASAAGSDRYHGLESTQTSSGVHDRKPQAASRSEAGRRAIRSRARQMGAACKTSRLSVIARDDRLSPCGKGTVFPDRIGLGGCGRRDNEQGSPTGERSIGRCHRLRAHGFRPLHHSLGRACRSSRDRRDSHAPETRRAARGDPQSGAGRAGHRAERRRLPLHVSVRLGRQIRRHAACPARARLPASAASRRDDRPDRPPAPGEGSGASRAWPVRAAGGTKVSSSPMPLERLTTGSDALDLILGGGLPVRSLSVIAGEPGAGKTLFALQVLFHLARQGKKGLYFATLSEPTLKLIQYMQQFAFFDERVIGKELIFADLGSVLRDGDANATLEAITRRVEQEEPAIVVIDSFKAVRDILGENQAIRTFTYDLAVHTASWG